MKYKELKNNEKFRKKDEKKFYNVFFFFLCLGIVTDIRLTRNIEAIENALGNEVYYFFSKTDREQTNPQTDFDEERMLIFYFY